MRDWLKTTAARLFSLCVVVIILLLIFVIRPVNQAKHTIKQQVGIISQAISASQAARNSLSSLPDIQQVKIQQLDSFRNYSAQASQMQIKLNKLSISPKTPQHILGLSLSNNSKIIADTNRVVSQSQAGQAVNGALNNIKAAMQLAAYHAQVSKALVNIMEYDPVADTASFSLGSDDSNQRLNLASQGLSKTLKSLDSLKGRYNDPTLNEVLNQVKSLQKSRDSLAISGDAAAWINAVSQAQSNIINNREKFWSSNVANLQAKISGNETQLAKIQKDWRDLITKYSLS